MRRTLVSSTRNERQYSRTDVCKFVHPARRQIGIRRAVKRTKNKEMPSIPRANEKFAFGIHGLS